MQHDARTADPDMGTGLIQVHPNSPRSLRVHQAVLAAATDLLLVGGPASVTIDAISKRSGVSTATIYKHWPCKTAVAAEAFGLYIANTNPLPDTGTSAGDLSEFLLCLSELYVGRVREIFTQLLADCVTHPTAAPYFREFFLNRRRESLGVLWERAVARGDVRDDFDSEIAADLLFGPFVFRMMAGHQEFGEKQARLFINAAIGGLLTSEAGGHLE